MFSLPFELARSVLDAAPDAMIIINAKGAILFANQQASTLFGYGHGEIVQLRVEDLMPERFRDRHLIHRQEYGDSVRLRPMGQGLSLFGLRRNGTEFAVEISLSPIHHDKDTLIAAAIRDVTDGKRAAEELRVARAAAEAAREIAMQAFGNADRANQGK